MPRPRGGRRGSPDGALSGGGRPAAAERDLGRSEADSAEVVVADLRGHERVGRGAGRGAGVVALDDVLVDPLGAEDAGEVDEALAWVLEAAGLVHVLDVELPDPT